MDRSEFHQKRNAKEVLEGTGEFGGGQPYSQIEANLAKASGHTHLHQIFHVFPRK